MSAWYFHINDENKKDKEKMEFADFMIVLFGIFRRIE